MSAPVIAASSSPPTTAAEPALSPTALSAAPVDQPLAARQVTPSMVRSRS